MKTLTIRDLPDPLHAALKERARRNRRSLNQQVIAELSRIEAFETDEDRASRVDREIRQAAELRSRATGFFTAEEIDAGKREGRA
jgi:plasmid stability protein